VRRRTDSACLLPPSSPHQYPKEDASMSRLKQALHNDFQLLETLHDELAVQAHLFKADMKQRWGEMEAKWDELKEHLGRAQVASGDVRRNVESSTKQLVDALTAGYAEIRNTFKH
jgi:hypothetical protein